MRTTEQSIAAYTWLRPKEVAARLACDPDHVLALIHAGDLPAIDIGTGQRAEYRVDPAGFEAFVQRRQVRKAEAA